MRPGRTSAPHAYIRARPGALWTGARGNAAGTALSAKALFPAQGRGRESVRGGGEGRRLLLTGATAWMAVAPASVLEKRGRMPAKRADWRSVENARRAKKQKSL